MSMPMSTFMMFLTLLRQVLMYFSRRCRSCPAIFVVVHLVNDVDKVDGQDDADVFGFPTVVDVQDCVEVNLCDLL